MPEDTRQLKLDGVDVHIEILAPGGMVNEHMPITHEFARVCHGALLLYSIASKASFDHITDYLEILREVRGLNITESLPIALVGNKCDLGDGPERQVERREGEELAMRLGLTVLSPSFREVSAKTGEGVAEVFDEIVRNLQNPQVERGEDKKLTGKVEAPVKSEKGIKGLFDSIVTKLRQKK
jgi:GTPase SAR1 family protein